jgi:glycosyltransferase involved in cell wall biosynthesis
VLPSIVDSQGNTEGLGVVLLEAMACGLPVIGSDVGGIPDIINDGKTGFLVKEKDVTALVIVLSRLITSPDLHEKLATTSKKLIHQKFSWATVSKMYERVYMYYKRG